MSVATKVTWAVLLLCGFAVFATGMFLAIVQPQDNAPTSAGYSGKRHQFAFNTSSRGFALVTAGAALLVFCLVSSDRVWRHAGRATSTNVLDTTVATTAVRASDTTPTAPPVQVPSKPSPSIVPPPTATPAHTLPCDGRWTTSLGSTEGRANLSPAEFLERMQLALHDDTVRLVETSNECLSLPPGLFQVVGRLYATGDEARADCIQRGLTSRHACFAEILTNSAADRSQRRYPDE